MKMGGKKVVEKEKFKTISIPAQLFERIKEEIKGTGLSVSSYITYVLKETLAESEEEESLTKEDEKLVKARLRALGYIE
jgi:predicted naringenin-chalcone synthase